MKKLLAIVLSCSMMLSFCGSKITWAQSKDEEDPTSERLDISNWEDDPGKIIEGDSKAEPKEPSFSGLNDPGLMDYTEQAIYTEVASQLGTDYQIENVTANYISKEYLEELSYNTKENVFYGYSLSELDAQFQGTRYVFTLDEKTKETTVVPFQEYDTTYEKVLKNVAIGTGVIVVCVTISVVTGGTAPAVSMIFAASAKSGTVFALSSGAFSSIIAGITTGVATGDVDESLKAALLAGSESFKWGAISGAVIGGGTELMTIKSASQGGLTMNEAATVMKNDKVPSNFVKQFSSMDEYNEVVQFAGNNGLTIQNVSSICMDTGYPVQIVKNMKTLGESKIYFEQAGLYAQEVNGQLSLIRDIDLNYVSELGGEMVTNLERMQKGYAAIDPVTKQAYQLHHIGQSIDSPFAILTPYEHMSGGNNGILHDSHIEEGVHKLLSNSEWAKQKEVYWKALAELLS